MKRTTPFSEIWYSGVTVGMFLRRTKGERKKKKEKRAVGQLTRQAFESQLSSSALLKRNFVTALSLHPGPGQPFRLSAHECKAEGLLQL